MNKKYIFYILSFFVLITSLVFVSNVFACNDPYACNYDYDDYTSCNYVSCNDGSCVGSSLECAQSTCEDQSMITCPDDGSCAFSYASCPCSFGESRCDDLNCSSNCSESNCSYSGRYYCPDGTCADSANDCACTPDSTNADCIVYYCGSPGALNTDTLAGCQEKNPNKNCIPSDGSCEYCTPDSTNADCIVYYCGVSTALNFQTKAACQAANNNMNCIQADNHCQYCDITSNDPRCIVYFCNDETALNSQSTLDCQANNPNKNCQIDNSLCMYDGGHTEKYCPTDPNEPANCESDPNNLCEPDNSVCPLTFCGYDVVVQYQKLDVIYNVEIIAAYFYDANIESCVPPNSNYIQQIIADTLDPLPTPPPSATTATGVPITPIVDQCPNISGNQDYAEFIDTYTRDSNGDCIIPVCPDGEEWDKSSRGCVESNQLHVGACNGALTTISPNDVTVGMPLSNNIGCTRGTGGPVSLTSNINGDPLYVWQCVDTGGSVSCNAPVGQCPANTTYCYGTCVSSTCEPPVDDGPNQDLGGHAGPVELNPNLKVTPIINPGGTCVVSWGKDAFGVNQGVFLKSTTTTVCTFSDQKQTFFSFNVTDPTAPTSKTQTNVLKDENYILKCSEPTGEVATSTGSCRLNVKPSEFN